MNSLQQDGPFQFRRRGTCEEARWTRLKIALRTGKGGVYAVERFEPLVTSAIAFLRDQGRYFRRLGHEVVSLEVTQANGFEPRRLLDPEPSRYWRGDGFELFVNLGVGAPAPEAVLCQLLRSD